MKNFLKSHTLLLALSLCLLTILAICTLEKKSCLKIAIYKQMEFIIGSCRNHLESLCKTVNSK